MFSHKPPAHIPLAPTLIFSIAVAFSPCAFDLSTALYRDHRPFMDALRHQLQYGMLFSVAGAFWIDIEARLRLLALAPYRHTPAFALQYLLLSGGAQLLFAALVAYATTTLLDHRALPFHARGVAVETTTICAAVPLWIWTRILWRVLTRERLRDVLFCPRLQRVDQFRVTPIAVVIAVLLAAASVTAAKLGHHTALSSSTSPTRPRAIIHHAS